MKFSFFQKIIIPLSILFLMVSGGLLYYSASRATASEINAKVYVITLPGNSEAIVLESADEDGEPIFGMVDAGEDDDFPDGTDPKYPYRPGTIIIKATIPRYFLF